MLYLSGKFDQARDFVVRTDAAGRATGNDWGVMAAKSLSKLIAAAEAGNAQQTQS